MLHRDPGDPIHVHHPRDVHVSGVFMALLVHAKIIPGAHKALEVEIGSVIDGALLAGYRGFECSDYYRGRKDGIKAGMERSRDSASWTYENSRENAGRE